MLRVSIIPYNSNLNNVSFAASVPHNFPSVIGIWSFLLERQQKVASMESTVNILQYSRL